MNTPDPSYVEDEVKVEVALGFIGQDLRPVNYAMSSSNAGLCVSIAGTLYTYLWDDVIKLLVQDALKIPSAERVEP